MIHYTVLESEYYQRALQFYRERILDNEPVHCWLGSHKARDEKLEGMILQHFREHLSWIAIDDSTGKLVGLRISYCIAAKDLPDNTPTYRDHIQSGWSESSAASNVFVDAALNVKEVLEQYNETKLLKLGGLAVDPAYQNKGIGTELVRRSLADGSKKGFSLAGVVASGPASQRVFRKLGFQEIKAVYFKDIQIDGEPRLKNFDSDTESIIAFVKKI